ncbi:major facilitator superfamily domain-containing protein [Cantharellus anzutake]|uniref:major facilitator superfamily domain-containing protein n=1 Tax=Cantharellus anzutake TaxID=1750568 RepID=UPI0019047384|nr:major facilitator superfamily domain-containing protein [Cantharellus anzutake]KAF8326380.1 major facilitator superfamily domain-containing protein [Cantharellus anzutake]
MAAPVVQVAPQDGIDAPIPLLAPEIQAEASGPALSRGDVWFVTPLPKVQVFLLAFASLSDPVIVTFVYPFINERIGDISNSPEQLARWSGLIFGCYALAQFLFVYVWGALSDRVGRRPIIMACLTICTVSTVVFGVVEKYWQMLLSRTISGISYGDVPVIRSAMGDVTDSTNQARAFSFIPLCWTIGSTIAPLIGGFLSHPERRFPDRFKNSQYFLDHPYALPCFVAAIVPAISFIFITLFFRETLPSHPLTNTLKHEEESRLLSPQALSMAGVNYGSTGVTRLSIRPLSQSEEQRAAASTTPPSQPEDHTSVRQILKDPIVRGVVLSYGLLAMISTSNDYIFALWMYIAVDHGGISLTPAQIATALSIGSIMGTLMLAFVFPPLHKKVGTLKIYRVAMVFDFIFILLYPAVHAIAAATVETRHHEHTGSFRHFPDPAHDAGFGGESGESWHDVPFWLKFGVAVMLIVKAIASLTWGSNAILVTAAAPSAHCLGKVNSLALMTASAARTIGPPMYASIFALSMNRHVLGGTWLIWIFMGAMALASLAVSFVVQEGNRPWRHLNPGDRTPLHRSE